jgi:Flp pilus assembly secretin CpaC
MRPCKMALQRSLVVAMLLIAWATSGLRAQTFESKRVLVGHSEIVKLSRPATTLIIGDPTVAEVSLPSGDLVLLTGKGPGTTNVIALGEDNVEVYRSVVEVGREINVIGLGKIQTYVCNPHCRLGKDSETIFSKSEQSAQQSAPVSSK